MWSQDYLAAPWTDQDLFDQLHANLTDVASGWTLFEDERATPTYPYVIYRKNLGVGRDTLLYIDITQSTSGGNFTSLRTFFMEFDSYVTVGELPTTVVPQTGSDFDRNSNLLINHASTPNLKNMMFWFEQGGTVIDSTTSLFSIEPYTLNDGVTLINTGDDGTSFPLWVSQYVNWNSAILPGGTYFNRNNVNFSIYFPQAYHSRPNRLAMYTDNTNLYTYNNISQTSSNRGPKSLFFRATRSPVDKLYTMKTRFADFAFYGATGSAYGTLSLPHKRIDSWAGAASFVEGFRPEIIAAEVESTLLKVDARGFLGEEGDLIIAKSFGGALGDAFTVGANSYRVVYKVNEGTSYTQLNVDLAMRVI